jgi:hypothetical protein
MFRKTCSRSARKFSGAVRDSRGLTTYPPVISELGVFESFDGIPSREVSAVRDFEWLREPDDTGFHR